jgi:uncharacterized protein YqcC (DUF446 family)
MDKYEAARERIGEIEAELKGLGWWQEERPPEEAFNFTMAFAMDTMAFPQWLQFVFIPRVNELIEARGSFPASSMVGAHAVREFDGVYEADRLVGLLTAFDDFIEGP